MSRRERERERSIDDRVDETEDLMAQGDPGLDSALALEALPTVAASEERRKLRRSVGRLDTAFLMLAAIIVLDTLGAVSSYGAQAFTWLVVMIIFFLVPYGLITAELGTAFPEEGGPYVWVKLAFGRAAAAVVSVMYWVDNPIWLAGTLAITAMATFGTFFITLSLAWQYVFGLIFIWVGIATVITALKFGKWVATGGAVLRVLLIAFFTLTVIFYAVGHGVHGFGGGAFKPTWAVFALAAPILIFNLEGFELPSSASEELKNPRRDVPFAVLRSGIGTVLFYGVPILLILLVLRPSQLSNVSGFIDAIQTVFVVYGGHTTASGVVLTGAGKILADICAIGVILGLLSSGAVWLIGSDRVQAVAGFDGAAPRWMGYFSKRLGTPIAVNLLSGVVSSGVLILALTLTSGNAAKYFSATLGLVISMVTFTYVLIFPAVIRLRYKYPDIERPYRIPGGVIGLWVAGILTTAWAAFTTLAVIYPGLGTAVPDASLPSGFAGERTQYTLSQVIPLAVMILIGLAFYALGRRTRQQLEPGVAAAEAVLAGNSATPAASGPALSGDSPASAADSDAPASAADGSSPASAADSDAPAPAADSDAPASAADGSSPASAADGSKAIEAAASDVGQAQPPSSTT
jgi:glutamate:GABA antiporter